MTPMAKTTAKASFGPELFSFLSDLRANNNREWFTANKQRYEEDVLEPALAFIDAFAPRLWPRSARISVPTRDRAAVRSSASSGTLASRKQDALQDEPRDPLPPREGQGRPRPRLLPAHRPGRGLRRRRHLARGHGSLASLYPQWRLREAAGARRRFAQARPTLGRPRAPLRGRPEAEGLLRLGPRE